ncbi:aldehyde ferredoxin oxidoreductase C-terminal domain-containing protein [Methanovulcanius yangii]|nr:aldehyde ferredoxin oxidoreductase C-terminal domain-containing protein [Methanovulcanius yangii]
MGSKNLKALAVRGEQEIAVADDDKLNLVKDRIRKKIEADGIAQALHDYGTAVLVNIINENYILPTNNFQSAHFEGAEKVSGETIKETIFKKPKGCYACIVQCGRIHDFEG